MHYPPSMAGARKTIPKFVAETTHDTVPLADMRLGDQPGPPLAHENENPTIPLPTPKPSVSAAEPLGPTTVAETVPMSVAREARTSVDQQIVASATPSTVIVDGAPNSNPPTALTDPRYLMVPRWALAVIALLATAIVALAFAVVLLLLAR